MKSLTTTRRRTLKMLLGLGALFSVPGQSQKPGDKKTELQLIDISGKKRKDPANETARKTAAGLGYVEDAALALKGGDKSYKPTDKPGPGGKVIKASEQFCHNCMFYAEVKKKVGGTCQLIPGVLVHEKGSCNTWMAKPS